MLDVSGIKPVRRNGDKSSVLGPWWYGVCSSGYSPVKEKKEKQKGEMIWAALLDISMAYPQGLWTEGWRWVGCGLAWRRESPLREVRHSREITENVSGWLLKLTTPATWYGTYLGVGEF